MTISLSQKQLCEYFGWNYKDLAIEAKAKGLSTHAFVQQKTGWILKQERYYPPFNHSSEIKLDPSFNNEP